VFKATLNEIVNVVDGELHGDGSLLCRGVMMDSREVDPGSLFVAISGDRFDGHEYVSQAFQKGAVAALVEKPVDGEFPQIIVASTNAAFLQLAAHWRSQQFPLTIAVTGSCGKTTVRQLLESIFKLAGKTHASIRSFNNHFGVPKTLLTLSAEHEYYVQEIGANHHGEILPLVSAVKPDVAIITNAAAAHLEGFGSLAGVASAKGEILSGLSAAGVAVLNGDDDFYLYWLDLLQGQQHLTFSTKQSAEVMAKDITMTVSGCASFRLICPLGEAQVTLKLVGRHHVANALAAVAAACVFQLSLSCIVKGLESALGEEGRLQQYIGYQGAVIIDDSYNANPTSVQSALNVLSHRQGKQFFIFGDMLELGEDASQWHEAVGREALALGIDHVLCYGPLSMSAAEAFGPSGQHFHDQNALITALLPQLDADSVVLVKGSFSMKMCAIVDRLLAVSID
tara:strand:+ start:1442 stop:2800 length:1359 start_codon:yes stop_codon:yes gene_type:complete